MSRRIVLTKSREINRLRHRERMRVIKVDTLLRVVYTLAIYLILANVANAQTVLNFASTSVNDHSNAGFAVTNPTSNFADVQRRPWGLSRFTARYFYRSWEGN